MENRLNYYKEEDKRQLAIVGHFFKGSIDNKLKTKIELFKNFQKVGLLVGN